MMKMLLTSGTNAPWVNSWCVLRVSVEVCMVVFLVTVAPGGGAVKLLGGMGGKV